MLTSGCVSILLTAILGGSPPGASPEGGPVAFKLQDFRAPGIVSTSVRRARRS